MTNIIAELAKRNWAPKGELYNDVLEAVTSAREELRGYFCDCLDHMPRKDNSCSYCIKLDEVLGSENE